MRLAAVTLALLLALPAASARAEEERTFENVTEAVAHIRAGGEYHSEAVGEGGDKSDTYRAYEYIRDHASAQTTKKLLDDGAPAVRAYAMQALIEHGHDVDHLALLKTLATSRDEVTTMFGCLVYDQPLGDVVVSEIAPLLPPQKARTFVDWIVEHGPRTTSRGQTLRDAEFERVQLPLLRRLADAGDADALVAVAGFKEDEDVARIAAALAGAADDFERLATVSEAAERHGSDMLTNPLAALAPKIAARLGEHRPQQYRAWVSAVCKLNNRPAADAIEAFLLAKVDDEHDHQLRAEFVAEAVRPHSRSLYYVGVHLELWTNSLIADLDTLVWLHSRYSDKVIGLADTRLRLPLTDRGDLGSTLDLLHRHESDAAEAHLVRLIPQMNWHHATTFCRRAAEWKLDDAVQPLLVLFEKSDDNLIYQPVARALLCFDRPAIDAALRKHAPSKDDPWNWVAKALESLPREYADR